MNIQVCNSLEEIICLAAKIFIRQVDGSHFSVIVPGGNTPEGFFRFLSRADIDWSNISLVLSDERMVPVNHKASNYGMIKKMLLEELDMRNKPHIIPEMEKFKDKANDNEKFLYDTNLLLKEKSPIVHAFLGLGSDGHTASLFPGDRISSENNQPYLITAKQGELYQRMTLSLHFLKRIPKVTFLVSGKSKQNAIKSILDYHKVSEKSPAKQLIEKSNSQINILCDHNSWPGKVYA